MSKTPANPSSDSGEIAVPFDRVAGLVRHLTHDIRNGLNTLDLQASFLQELVTDPEAAPEVKRMRSMITTTAKMLQSFSASFWLGELHPVTYAAKIFVEDFRSRLGTVLPDHAGEIAWTEALGDESIAVDIEMIFRAVSEIFKNAVHFHEKGRTISAHVACENGHLVLKLQEGKTSVASSPETWGAEPLISTRRGGFGMGLFHARRILAAHQGNVEFAFDPAAEMLTTRVSLPLAA